MQWSIRLGALKPAVFRQTEKTIWKAVLDIVNRPGDYMAILKRLASAFPSAYIRELEGRLETVPGWFNIDLQGDMVPSGTLVVGKTISGEEKTEMWWTTVRRTKTKLKPVIQWT